MEGLIVFKSFSDSQLIPNTNSDRVFFQYFLAIYELFFSIS